MSAVRHKIKILEIHNSSRYCDECNNHHIDYGITDWDEVTDKQYWDIRTWTEKRNNKEHRKLCGKDSTYYIVVEFQGGPEKAISEYLEMVKEDNAKDATRQKKAEENKRKRAKKQKEKEKADWEKLDAKYGSKEKVK